MSDLPPPLPPSTNLYLHETVDIVGQGAMKYMRNIVDAAGNETNNFTLQGTWYVMGITGRWPQVINIWDVPRGWDGWYESVDRLNLKRSANIELAAWWDDAFKLRTGGFDRLLAGSPHCPTTQSLIAGGVRGSLFLHEVATVRQGSALDYLAAVAAHRVPLMAEFGFTNTGLYETLMTGTEAITVWAGDVAAHTSVLRAEQLARHGLGGDSRFVDWRRLSEQHVMSWREELMTPAPGMVLGPPDGQESDGSSDSERTS